MKEPEKPWLDETALDWDVDGDNLVINSAVHLTPAGTQPADSSYD
jgi:hypothetical protein